MTSRRVDDWLRALVSSDPVVRDEGAYTQVASALRAGEVTPAERSDLAAAMVEQLGHPQIHARTIAPLVLARLVDLGDWQEIWGSAVCSWYLSETDLRGHDPHLGWLHAMAHGADFLGAATRSTRMTAAQATGVIVERLVAPTDHRWRDQEEARSAHALALACIVAPDEVDWLERIERALQRIDGPPPIWAANTLSTLTSLSVAFGLPIRRGEHWVVLDAPVVEARVLDVIATTQPWFWRRLP